MKKLSICFMTIVFMLMSSIYIYAAENLEFKTTSLARGSAYENYYDKIEASGGSGNYHFEYAGGVYPKGIVFGEDGTISGTPESSGIFTNIRIKVTDKDSGESITQRFSLKIDAKHVEIEISDTEYVYEEGQSYKATVICTTDSSVIPTVTYGNGVSEVTKAGSHVIKVKLPSGYKCDYKNDKLLMVYKNDNSSISVENLSVPYDGLEHPAQVTVSPADLLYEVLYKKSDEEEYSSEAPVERGVYDVLARTMDNNYTQREARATIQITNEIVKFEISDNSQRYTGSQLEPTITPSKDIDYTVTYKNIQTGEESEQVTDIGTYQVIITPAEGYDAKIVSDDKFVITNSIVNVTVTADNETITYGETFKLSAQTDVECDMNHLVLELVNNETNELFSAEEIVPAGTYSVRASFDYENGEAGVGTVTAPTLTVGKKTVSFTPSAAVLDYTGDAQTVTFTPSSNLVSDSDYSVKYNLNGNSMTAMQNPGSYKAEITFISNNFVLDDSASDIIIKINPYAYLNAGNSPAAMIEKDTSKSDIWKTSAKEFFTKNRYFTEEYLPQYCKTGITYTSINGTNYDIDESTFIVKKWSDFEDPGMTVIDESGVRTVYGTVESTPAENDSAVCEVKYTDAVAKKSRTVIVLGVDFGDVNGDGFINAIDGNEIRKRANAGDVSVENIFDARICDISKDGILNKQDAEMIYNRFEVELLPYYPWIE